MDWSKLIVVLPKWVLVFLAVVLAVAMIYSLSNRCTIEVFGLGFGPRRSCGPVSDGALPVGSIVAWSPATDAVLPADGQWVVCGTHPGTPSLDERFLMGVSSLQEAGKEGGSNEITTEPSHDHSGETAQANASSGERVVPCSGNCGGRATVHKHGFTTSASAAHNHGGDNRPRYRSVLFLCRIQ